MTIFVVHQHVPPASPLGNESNIKVGPFLDALLAFNLMRIRSERKSDIEKLT